MPPSALVVDGTRRRALTRDDVIERIRRWHALFGEPPTTADWNPSLARWRAQEWRIERYRAGDPQTGAPWPALNSAKRVFDGSFDAAVRAAGLVPHRPGPRRRGRAGRPAGPDGDRPVDARVADAELLAASARLLAAERRAARAEERAERAEARLAALALAPVAARSGRAGTAGRLSAAELAALRAQPGPVGPAPLALALRELAAARAAGDGTALRRALHEVAAAAVRWGERL